MGYLKKLVVCLLAGITVVITLQRISYRLIWEWVGHHYPPPMFALFFGVLILLAAVVYSFLWQGKEKKGLVDSPAVLAMWQSILAGSIGLDLAMFGWQKLFHQQFIVPMGRLDEPFNSFSGEDLTWAYFAASYVFTCVIGVCQIVGSFLLFVKRTRLFGAIFLFPVLLNITLIDIFYGLEAGVTVHAILLMIGVLYLIFQQYGRLVAFFFSREGRAGFGAVVMPIALVVLLPLLLVASFRSPDRNPQLTGKYDVQALRVNGESVAATSCQDSVLTSVIFDLNNEMVLEFNSLQRRWIGNYRLDRSTGGLVASWHFPAQAKDTLVAKLEQGRPGAWHITGSIGATSFQALLVKSVPPAGPRR